MTTSIEELAKKIFKRTGGNPSTRDLHAFNVLQAIDGRRSVGMIAQQDHYELSDLAAVIEQLINDGAIAPIHADESKTLGADFLKNMEAELGQIMGPVSGMIIEEHVAELGIDAANVPIGKAHEMIALVSQSIPDPSQSEAFIRQMNDFLES